MTPVGDPAGSGSGTGPAAEDVARFRTLLTPLGQRLLDDVMPYDEESALAVGERLRRDGFDPPLVSAALTQARLRARARTKFGPRADLMFFTSDGLEQATRPAVAVLHAQRYAAAATRHVADLCCGIGSDLSSFAAAGLPVVGVERDPLTCEVARANTEALGLGENVEIRRADVTSPELDLSTVDAVFIDPSRRRAGGARTFDPQAYSPTYDAVLDLARRVPATGAKLAPGIPHDVLPESAEAEWVSADGTVVECGLWFGPLVTGARRRATLLPGGATLTGDGTMRGEVGPVRRFLYEPDGAVIRAGLVAEAAALVGANLVDPEIAYLTSDDRVATQFCTAYEVTDVLPFQLKRLRALLRARGVGPLTVKKRGSAITPEVLRRQLRLTGDAAATVVLTRVRGQPYVLVVEPVTALAHGHASTSTR